MGLRIGIQQKLVIIFFLFFVIFSGTMAIVLSDIRQVVDKTETIITNNRKIDELAESLQTSLLEMDANNKKLTLLKRKGHFDLFLKSTATFEKVLQQLLILSNSSPDSHNSWIQVSMILDKISFKTNVNETSIEKGFSWMTDEFVAELSEIIKQAKKNNQIQIEQALDGLYSASKAGGKNALIGFCLSILIGIVGILFISRSIFAPLKTLTIRLRDLSLDVPQKPILLKGGDVFHELSSAFNNMNQHLAEEESIRREFIATLSHEIRTPLSSIHESVKMIADEVLGPINEKQRKFLEIADVELIRITKLLSHLLNVESLSLTNREKPYTYFSSVEMIHESVQLFSATITKKNLDVNIDSCHNCPQLFGLKEEMQQVFINVLSNAIKFSPFAGQIMISWEPDKQTEFISFHISDDGPGVADDEKTLIFSKYYRTKSSRSHFDGVGLGLAISNEIVRKYKGCIYVNNNNVTGCTFSFSLPTKPSK
jgi:signal transduction histidine kinase